MNQIFRVFTIVILVLWVFYWKIKEIQSKKNKPENEKVHTLGYLLSKYGFWVLDGIVILQLLGYAILPLRSDIYSQSVGIILVCTGFIIACSARITLDSNWSNAYDYQIKKRHELIHTGIYNFIRHPIYTGMILGGTGAELVAESYGFVPMFMLMSLWAYIQALKEEAILTNHFGTSYKNYVNNTWMFIPYIL